MKWITLFFFIVLLMGCANPPAAVPTANVTTAAAESSGESLPEKALGGMGSGMMMRHHARIPEDYAGMTAPTELDDAALGRGQALYAMHCVSCHGEIGLGDGPAGAALDPAPSPIAHTSQMLSDDYLFWRLSEGGLTFGSSMPAWKDVLDEGQRWEVIQYVRLLGRDSATVIATAQAARQATMLEQALEQGVLSQAQADAFRDVHDKLEAYLTSHAELSGTMEDRENSALQALMAQGEITQAQAEGFRTAHDLLAASGLMP